MTARKVCRVLDHDLVYSAKRGSREHAAPAAAPVYENHSYVKGFIKAAALSAGLGAVALGAASYFDPARVHDGKKHTHRSREHNVYRGSTQQLAQDVRNAASTMNPEGVSDYLYAMENDIGKRRMVGVLVAATPGMPMPDSVEFDRFLEVSARKKGLDPFALRKKYKDDPEGFAEDFFGKKYRSLLDGDIRLVLVGVGINAVREAAGETKLHDHYNTLVEVGGPTGNYISQFRQQNGRDPSAEELGMGRLTNSMTLDSNRAPERTYPATSWSQNGQSGETRTYSFGQPDEVQRSYMDANSRNLNVERRAANERSAREMANAAAQTARRAQGAATRSFNDFQKRLNQQRN